MKNEARYENPVNLFISKSYDDAETAQEFIKDLAGEQLSVSKGRNGDYLYVSIEGADEDIEAFLDVYKDEYGDIVKDCGVEGWVTPEDVYYASVEGKKELLGESQKNERGNDDYLQEVWDSLEGSWDKDKFDMGKGYDSEYDCECITITSKDNEEVRAKIYIEDYEGRHPVAFNVVYRYPGDHGVGVMGTYEFQSTDMDGLGEEVFDYFDEIKQKVGKSMNNESFDMSRAFFDAKKAITDWTKNQNHKTLEWLYTDGRKSPTSYPSGIWDFEWDTGDGMATAEIKVSPYETRTNSWNDSLDFALKSGPEGKYMYYTSAEDVLYALDKLIRDTEFKGESKKSESDETSWALEYLVETAKEKGLKVSWEGSNEICITIGTFPHQDHIFVTDDAPGKDDTSLELYVPAAHINTSGLTLQDVLDYLDDPIGKRDAVQFKNGNRSGKVEVKKSEGLPPKKLGSNRQYRSRADLINKMKTLDAVEITTPAQFNDIHSKQWLHTAGYALDTNGNLVAQSYYGDKDGKWYYATTKTFQGDYLPECKEAKKSEKKDDYALFFETRVPGELTGARMFLTDMWNKMGNKKPRITFETEDPDFDSFVSHPTARVFVCGDTRSIASYARYLLAHYDEIPKDFEGRWVWKDDLAYFARGFKESLESKKLESLTLKQKELKDMARYGEAEDITTISDAEAKELKKKGIETVGISRGVYGMNGALLRDNEGNKYVITARSSNLFYFV